MDTHGRVKVAKSTLRQTNGDRNQHDDLMKLSKEEKQINISRTTEMEYKKPDSTKSARIRSTVVLLFFKARRFLFISRLWRLKNSNINEITDHCRNYDRNKPSSV